MAWLELGSNQVQVPTFYSLPALFLQIMLSLILALQYGQEPTFNIG